MRFFTVFCLLLVFVSVIPSAAVPLEQGEASASDRLSFEPHVALLNELAERRRSNVYFVNRQSSTYGAQLGYVNVGRGNLTFLRRDLVVVGRIPLVAARVYDSSSAGSRDFGPGWRLSAAEAIRWMVDGTLVLTDETGSDIRLASAGDRSYPSRYRMAIPAPSNLHEVFMESPKVIRVTTRSGYEKRFEAFSENGFHLTSISDRNGNRISLEYGAHGVARIVGANGRFLRAVRDPSGRISALTDEQHRSVRYRYGAQGRLAEVVDLAGNVWSYSYTDDGRLSEAINPLGHPDLVAQYGTGGKVHRIRYPGGWYELTYAGRTTLAIDGSGRVSTFVHKANGMTLAVGEAYGDSRVVLDGQNRVVRLARSGSPVVDLRYDDRGRLAQLTAHETDATEIYTYLYDDSSRLAAVENRSRPAATVRFFYDREGNLAEMRESGRATRYTYSDAGDLKTLRLGDDVYRFEHDADGQITRITNNATGALGLEYQPDGKLARTDFGDDELNRYDYNELGMRTRIASDRGSLIEYGHNPLGSVEEVRVSTPGGAVREHRMVLDAEQKVRQVDYSGGRELRISYDEMGNPRRLESDQGTYFYGYDTLQRITSVRGDAVVLDYRYGPGEQDLRIQLDDRTRPQVAHTVSTSLTFSSGLEILRARALNPLFDHVAFNPSTLTFEPAGGVPFTSPTFQHRTLAILEQIGLLGTVSGDPEGRQRFEKPSNILFRPAEYVSVNCCIYVDCAALGIVCPYCWIDNSNPYEPLHFCYCDIPTPPAVDTLEVLYTIIIPADHIRQPEALVPPVFFGSPWEPEVEYSFFGADNVVNWAPGGTFRTQQKAVVTIGPGGGLTSQSATPGQAREYLPILGQLQPGNCVRNGCSSCKYFTGQHLFHLGQCKSNNPWRTANAANMGSVVTTQLAADSSSVTIRMVGAPRNPLTFLGPFGADVDWRVDMNIRKNANGSFTVTGGGSHDGFPRHTIHVAGIKVFDSGDPFASGRTPLELLTNFDHAITINQTISP